MDFVFIVTIPLFLLTETNVIALNKSLWIYIPCMLIYKTSFMSVNYHVRCFSTLETDVHNKEFSF